MEGIHALLDQRLDRKDAALLFYALQTASGNVKSLTIEPKEPDLSRKQWLYKKRSIFDHEIHKYRDWESVERDRLERQIREEFRKRIEAGQSIDEDALESPLVS